MRDQDEGVRIDGISDSGLEIPTTQRVDEKRLGRLNLESLIGIRSTSDFNQENETLQIYIYINWEVPTAPKSEGGMIFGLNLASYLFQILPHLEFDFAKSSRYRRNSIPESETGQDEIATEVKSQLHVRADPGLTALVLEYSTIITTSDTIP